VFAFVLCGAARLARFNVTENPMPRNPGRPDRKYFVGLPIPAAAAMVASVVYFFGSEPLVYWPFVCGWLVLLGLLSYLMICLWRYRSFKDLNLVRPRGPLIVVVLGFVIYAIWNFSQIFLLLLSTGYVLSGILVRLGGSVRRRILRRRTAHEHTPEPAAGAH
jgi:CDP-diacylglycerol--serine O-phosphatidyltransferase